MTMSRTRRWILIGGAALALYGGGLLTPRGRPAGSGAAQAPREEKKERVWTCSMHPQIRLPNPGKCPICDMPLVPAEAGAGSGDGRALTLSDHARSMAAVETAHVTRRPLEREIRAAGKVQVDERAVTTVTARVDGYVERLYVNTTGVAVKAGDPLLELYSPELVTAQSELLAASGANAARGIAEAARAKLRQWSIDERQIDEIVRTREVKQRLVLASPAAGTVMERRVANQSAVQAGEVLYRLAALDSVWVTIEIFEPDVSSVRAGQPVDILVDALPGPPARGAIAFVSPTLDEQTRTVRARVEVANPEGRLKPGMFARAIVRVPLGPDGLPAADGSGRARYRCPMHPNVVQASPGHCPACEMPLEREAPVDGGPLAVPATAILDTGRRKLAYVERSRGEFIPVEVNVGERAGDYYPVLAGLKEHDAVAVRGAFLIDSQAQILGMPSLLNEKGTAPEAPSPSSPGAPAPAAPGHPH